MSAGWKYFSSYHSMWPPQDWTLFGIFLLDKLGKILWRGWKLCPCLLFSSLCCNIPPVFSDSKCARWVSFCAFQIHFCIWCVLIKSGLNWTGGEASVFLLGLITFLCYSCSINYSISEADITLGAFGLTPLAVTFRGNPVLVFPFHVWVFFCYGLCHVGHTTVLDLQGIPFEVFVKGVIWG